jgi:hypothetical protein
LHLERHPVGNAVQVARQRGAFRDRRCPPSQHQEGRLTRILGILGVVQHTATDAQHHRRVATDDEREGSLVALGEEAIQ